VRFSGPFVGFLAPAQDAGAVFESKDDRLFPQFVGAPSDFVTNFGLHPWGRKRASGCTPEFFLMYHGASGCAAARYERRATAWIPRFLFSFSTTRVSVFAMRVFMLDAILFQGQIGPLSISPVHSALQV
jgi:hypothetical protein